MQVNDLEGTGEKLVLNTAELRLPPIINVVPPNAKGDLSPIPYNGEDARIEFYHPDFGSTLFDKRSPHHDP